MPRSIRRRLELLERRTTDRTHRVTSDELHAWLELAVAVGRHPLVHLDSFRAAWAGLLDARDRAAAEAGEPPPTYRPGQPETRRKRLWLAWDHPALNDAVGRVLEV